MLKTKYVLKQHALQIMVRIVKELPHQLKLATNQYRFIRLLRLNKQVSLAYFLLLSSISILYSSIFTITDPKEWTFK